MGGGGSNTVDGICVSDDLDPNSAGYQRGLPILDDLRARLESFGVTPADG